MEHRKMGLYQEKAENFKDQSQKALIIYDILWD